MRVSAREDDNLEEEEMEKVEKEVIVMEGGKEANLQSRNKGHVDRVKRGQTGNHVHGV